MQRIPLKKQPESLAIPLKRKGFLHWLRLGFIDLPVTYAGGSTEILLLNSFRSFGRDDYDQMIIILSKELSSFGVDVASNNKIFSRFYVLKLIQHLFEMLKAISLRLLGIRKPHYKNFFMDAIEYVYKDNLIKILHVSRPKVIVTLCDAHPQDHIATRVFSSHGVLTVTLQHGQFYLKGGVNDLLITNCISDFVLVWGDRTKSQFKSVPDLSVKPIVLGPLKKGFQFDSHDPGILNERLIGLRNTSKVIFVLLLNSDVDFLENAEIIKFVNQACFLMGAFFCLRFHPKSRRSRYLAFTKSEKYIPFSSIEESDDQIYLFYDSAVVLEIFCGSHILVKFNNKRKTAFDDYMLQFYDAESLVSICSLLGSNSSKIALQMSEYFQQFLVPGNTLYRYREFFANLRSLEAPQSKGVSSLDKLFFDQKGKSL